MAPELTVAADVGGPAGVDGGVRHLATALVAGHGADELIALVRKFGDQRDAESLFRLSQEGDSNVRRAAADAFVHFALQHTDFDSALMTLLNRPEERIRLAAVGQAASRLTREQIDGLIKNYQAQQTYYYDVVCWLDRIAYAPAPFGDVFKTTLKNNI